VLSGLDQSPDLHRHAGEENMQEYTIYPLVFGINETDQGVMTYLRDYGKRIYLPIPVRPLHPVCTSI
jgi:hypothetical protein